MLDWDGLRAGLDLGREREAVLRARFRFGPQLMPPAARESQDGMRKYAYGLASGDVIEAVLIRNRANRTLCLSSPAGCAMGCSFCATGKLGLRRNMTDGAFRAPTWAEVKDFTTRLRRLSCPVKVRYSAGKQNGMGCGQLSAETVAARPTAGHMLAPPGIFSA